MKYLTFLFLILSFVSCRKDTRCGEGMVKSPFSGNCIEDKEVFYLGKTAFYCFDDSLALGVDTSGNTVSVYYKDKLGRAGGAGDFNYTEYQHFLSSQCEVDTLGFDVTNTVVYFEDISLLDVLPDKIVLKLYQADWNIPYTRFDSTKVTMYRR